MATHAYSLTHLGDHELDHGLQAAIGAERGSTANAIAYIAESDARRRYAVAGYPSMHAYCVGHLRLSKDAAFRRIRAARQALKFPAIFAMIADGRLSLTSIVLLAPHLHSDNASELLAAAAHKTTERLEALIAERFPQPDLSALLAPVATPEFRQLAVKPVQVESGSPQLAPTPAATLVVAPLHPRVRPLAPERYAFQATIPQATRDKLRRAQELLGHRLPAGDLAGLLDLALDALIEKHEKRRFAATERPQAHVRESRSSRHIPSHVKRAVAERDGGRCTYVSDAGHRCEARSGLEFDHERPVARGGESTVSNVRLRCRAHNQLDAERVFGAGFMAIKRQRPHEAIFST